MDGAKVVKTVTLVCLAIIAIWPPLSHGEDLRRTVGLQLNSDNGGAVGRLIAFELREQLAKSTSLRPWLTPDAAVTARIIFDDHDRGTIAENKSTAYSFVLTTPHAGGPMYLGQFVGVCGAKKVEQCAKELLANVSEIEIWTPAATPSTPIKSKSKK